MAAQFNMHDAKTHFSRLVAKVERGQEVVIAKAGVPVARLVPVNPKPGKRRLGTAKGQIWMSEDFDAPLPPEILRDFYGEE